MSLENYLVKSDGPFVEICSFFDEADLQALYNRVNALGREEWMKFVNHRLSDISKYVSSSPSQRQSKRWQEYPELELFRFAALQAAHAAVLLMSYSEPIAYIVDRGSYRKFHSAFLDAFLSIHYKDPWSIFPLGDFPPLFQH